MRFNQGFSFLSNKHTFDLYKRSKVNLHKKSQVNLHMKLSENIPFFKWLEEREYSLEYFMGEEKDILQIKTKFNYAKGEFRRIKWYSLN